MTKWNEPKQLLEMTGGIEARLLNTLCEKLDFSYELIDLKNNWGAKLPNNTWVGLIGKIVNNVMIGLFKAKV